MTDSTRELFLKILSFEKCERTLRWEMGYWNETLIRWYKEGLPKIKGLPGNAPITNESSFGPAIYLWSKSYVDEKRDQTVNYDVSNCFNFDEGYLKFPYNYWLYPRFDEKIIFEDDNSIEFYGSDGIKRKNLKESTSMPMWIEWPVKNRKDWEIIKEDRFNFNTIDKRFYGILDNYIKKNNNRTAPLILFDAPCGFFGSLRTLIGENNLYFFYYDNPNLLKDIINHLLNLWLLIAEELTSKIDFDIACFFEDMAGKNGSLISPSIFKEFMSPCYKKLINFLKSKGIKYFFMDCDGKLDELIPLFLEVGFNVIYPVERQAGNDLLKLRKEYPQLRIMGGFDKNTLYKGKEYINRELELITPLIKDGGYIPFADHLIPPNSSWENFRYYREKLNEIINSTKVRNKEN